MDWETEGAPAKSIQASNQSVPRQSARFELDVSLVARPTKNRSHVVRGRIFDLSCAGIRAVIAAELQVGDALELEFEIPYTSAVVLAEASIRWRQRYQYGLEFVRVSASDRERIDRACVALDLLR